MKIIKAMNAHDALSKGMLFFDNPDNYSVRSSRNGDVYVSDEPVATVYALPSERVIFHRWRDANPFFHLYEGLWMLAGRDDVKPLTKYVKRMSEYSDDGETFSAAYGWRWRNQYSEDQLDLIIGRLSRDPTDRRSVLQIWNAERDLDANSKDVACNVAITFQVGQYDELNMVVFNRSNDMIWGAYGANVVHLSMLHEYVARSIGHELGSYTQISVNFHVYVDIYKKMVDRQGKQGRIDADMYYDRVRPYPLMSTPRRSWDVDVQNFITEDGYAPDRFAFQDPFFEEVALPVVRAHDAYKDGKIGDARMLIQKCAAPDWRIACQEWLERRDK